MAIKKIEIRPKGTGDYADVLYPKTSVDMVIDEATGQTVATHLADKANPHNVTATQVGALKTSGGTLTGAITVPEVTIGDVYAYDSSGLNFRTGVSPNYRYFKFNDNGNLEVLNGSVLVQGVDLKTSVDNGKFAVRSAIIGKGGNVVGSHPNSFVELENGVNTIPTGKKFASGTLTSSGTGTLAITGLDHQPSCIIIDDLGGGVRRKVYNKDNNLILNKVVYQVSSIVSNAEDFTITTNGFSTGGLAVNTSHAWKTIE